MKITFFYICLALACLGESLNERIVRQVNFFSELNQKEVIQILHHNIEKKRFKECYECLLICRVLFPNVKSEIDLGGVLIVPKNRNYSQYPIFINSKKILFIIEGGYFCGRSMHYASASEFLMKCAKSKMSRVKLIPISKAKKNDLMLFNEMYHSHDEYEYMLRWNFGEF